MKISYIIPVYKVEEYLPQCMESILSQKFDDYEIILIDDESPDGCPQICDDYAKKYPDIVKVIHQKNTGWVKAKNAGIRVAKGDYLILADSDDFFIEDRIEELYSIAVKNNLDILHNSYSSHNDFSGNIVKTVPELELNHLYTHEELEKELCHAHEKFLLAFVWRNLYKREFLINNNIFFDENLRMVADAPFDMLAFSKAERFMAVDIPNYRYRIREGSLQRQKFIKDYDKMLNYQWTQKRKNFSENCHASKDFDRDIAIYTIISLLPMLMSRAYSNNVPEKYDVLKRVGKSEMMRQSFKDYDINEFRSRSLDWIMTWLIKHKLFFPAHLICKKIYK